LKILCVNNTQKQCFGRKKYRYNALYLFRKGNQLILRTNFQEDDMAFTYKNAKGVEYVLHGRETTLKNGKKQMLYFFAKEAKDGAMDAVPAGYQVSETANGLPVLKKA
jgi:hypothetical protein